MLLLSIDSSCDETAAAVVRDGRIVLSNIIASQVAVHAEYGGVVPEIASRRHVEAIPEVVRQALSSASISLAEIEGIAVTRGPGLVGALLIGISTAKAIALARKIPVVGVNHIEGHLFAPFLDRPIEFPFVALVVSGGHTHIYLVEGVGKYCTLGQTLDDAAGEAFDKVAKLLGLPYPGGVVIDRLAAEGNPSAIKFPRPLLHDGTFNFSFSGLKTAVLTHLQKHPAPQGPALADICASFQAAVSEVVVTKTLAAVRDSGIRRLAITGGVACNRGLRHLMTEECRRNEIDLRIPPPVLCTDNAAMIAVPGDFYLSNGITDGFELDSRATWPLDEIRKRLEFSL